MTDTGPETDPPEAVLPDRADDDTDVGWGDERPSDDEDMSRLLDERPPHHEDFD
jgi:hypothetical protein